MGNTLPGSTVSAPTISVWAAAGEAGFGVSFFFSLSLSILVSLSILQHFHGPLVFLFLKFFPVFLRRVIEFHRPLGLSTFAASNACRSHNQRLIIYPYLCTLGPLLHWPLVVVPACFALLSLCGCCIMVFAGAQFDLGLDGQAPYFSQTLGFQCLALGHHGRLPGHGGTPPSPRQQERHPQNPRQQQVGS